MMSRLQRSLYLRLTIEVPVSRQEEEFEDTKGVIRILISKRNRQRNGQKRDKQRSTKQNPHKPKGRVTRTPLNTRVDFDLIKSGYASYQGSNRTVQVTLQRHQFDLLTQLEFNPHHGQERWRRKCSKNKIENNFYQISTSCIIYCNTKDKLIDL